MKESENSCASVVKNCLQKSTKKTGRTRRSFVRNIRRRQRRKRSHNRYYKNLRQLRRHRKYEELCSEVEAFAVFDISSKMEWNPVTSNTDHLLDVAEWHQKEQVAYWKSRALSLEYENRMLYKHLRDVYAQQIETYRNYRSKNVNSPHEIEVVSEKNVDENDRYTEISMDIVHSPESEQRKKIISGKTESVEFPPPSEPVGKKRREEMEKLYGSHCARIAGIETALQLNFEHTAAKLKPAHWPQLQLNLG